MYRLTRDVFGLAIAQHLTIFVNNKIIISCRTSQLLHISTTIIWFWKIIVRKCRVRERERETVVHPYLTSRKHNPSPTKARWEGCTSTMKQNVLKYTFCAGNATQVMKVCVGWRPGVSCGKIVLSWKRCGSYESVCGWRPGVSCAKTVLSWKRCGSVCGYRKAKTHKE